MPRMDGTGPTGQGPMTGRGLGPCGTNKMRTMQSITEPNTTSWIGRLLMGLSGVLNPGAYGDRRGMGTSHRRTQGRRRSF